MRNNFLNLVAKMPQNTGGGTSRTKNRSVTVNLSSDTTTNREMTERRPREDRETFGLRSSLLGTLKYVACLLLALVLGIGNMWGETWTAAEIISSETKGHLTISSPGVTAVTSNVQQYKNQDPKVDAVKIDGTASAGSFAGNKVLSIVADYGYVIDEISIEGVSSSTSNVKVAYVGWESTTGDKFLECNSANTTSFPKNSNNEKQANITITPENEVKVFYLYNQIKTNSDYNAFATSKTIGSTTAVYVVSVSATAKLATPKITGAESMLNDETIPLTGFPIGGAWTVVSGPGEIDSEGNLTANGNGTIRVKYTHATNGEITKDIVAGTTKNLTWEFNTKDVLPTTAGITAVNVNGTFETAGQLKLDNGAYVAIDLTSKDYIITAASINARTGSDSKLINFGSALSTTADGNVNSSSSYADIAITPVTSSSIFSLSKNNSGVYVAKITLTVKKAVKHTLSYAVIPAGKATVTLSKTSVAEGGTATATYSGIDGAYEFDEWQISGTGASIDNAKANPVTVTMGTDDAVVTLKLKLATTKYDVTAATGLTGGSVAASAATEAEGETVTITATPAFRYLFGAWDVYKTDDPTTKVSVTETAGVYTFEMPNYPVTVSASFTEDSRKQILYLTTAATGSDKLYAALNSEATYNVIVEAPASQTLTNYDLVVLHESIDGKSAAASDNTNKKQVILDIPTTTIPVLNTKSYFYTNSGTKRWDWGAPNNGAAAQKVATLNTSYSNIADHPIFDGVTITANTVKVLTDDVTSGNTMQPIGTFTTGKEGYTLATTPNNGDGNGDGCAIHELTPTQRGVASGKYLMISVSNAGLNNLTADGQKLFKNAAAYLLDGEAAWVPAEAATDDATLKALSVSGLTLSPTFAAATVDYTVTKAYGADDPAVSAVTATPTADGATAEVKWNGTNKKFTITVTAVDNTTKKEYTITVNEAAAPKSLSRVLFSNGFDAFIDNTNHTVKAFYLSGTAEPTATTITAGEGTAGALSEGKIRVTGADDSFVDYTVTIEAVTPNTTTVAAEAEAGAFDGTEAWVKNGLLEYGTAAGYSAGDKWYVIRRLLKSGDAADDQRVIAGWVRSYFFVGNAYKFIMTVSNHTDIKYSIDGGEQVASNAATVEITLPAGNHMIEIVSNQSNGDCRLSAPKLVERPATYSVTYKAGEGTGDDVVDAFEYAAGDEVTVQANAFTAPANKKFNGWASAPAVTISEGKFEMPASNVVLTAQWKEYFTITYKDGETILGTEDVFTDATPAGIAYPSKVGYDFAGWVDGEDNPVTIASLNAAATVYAKWTTDPCSDKKSVVKVVMTAYNDAAVTGYNNNEYAGGKIINNLSNSSDNKNTYDFGEGEVTGYKLASSKSAIMATLAKGDFEYGDKIVVAVTNPASAQKLRIYAASDVDHVLLVKEIDAAAAGIYEYKFTSAEIEAINDAGYKSIGVFRGDYNPFVYSVELKGCRSWAIFHTLTFKNIDGTATIATENLAEGDFASTVAPTAPIVEDKHFIGWAETIDGTPVNLASYTITDDKTLYAVYGDCPTSGTVFKFTVATGKTNGNIFATTPNSMELTTENYLAELEGGSVVAAVSGSDNNRLQYYDGKALGFYSGSQGSLTLKLECPMEEGDLIRFINYENNNQKFSLKGDDHTETLAGNSAETVQTLSVPAEWDGLRELTLTRSNNTPKISYFEIYRRPVATGVSLADMTMRTGKTKTPVMTLTPSDDAIVTSQAWTIESSTPADIATINATTGEISATAEGTITVKVVLNGDAAIYDECTVTIVENITQQNVEGSIVWNWKNAGNTAIQLSNDTDPKKNEGFVMANVDVNNDPNFESDKLYVEGEYILRDPDKTNPYFQGQTIKFNTTVAGLVRVTFSNTGNNHARELYINGVGTGVSSASGTFIPTNLIEVPAGEVSITAFYVDPADGTTQQYVRVAQIEFFAENTARARTLAVGNLGTTCIENECIVRGAEIYAIKGKNEIGKIVFEELGADEVLEAGHPYVMVAKEANIRFFNTIEEPATEPYDANNGLIGTFEQKVFAAGEASNGLYFFKDHALWAAKTTGMTIPAYRCYLDMTKVGTASPNPAPGRRRIVLGVQGEQVATGIDELNASEAPVKVMIDGQLFIIRGEKMYNANGQLVK